MSIMLSILFAVPQAMPVAVEDCRGGVIERSASSTRATASLRESWSDCDAVDTLLPQPVASKNPSKAQMSREPRTSRLPREAWRVSVLALNSGRWGAAARLGGVAQGIHLFGELSHAFADGTGTPRLGALAGVGAIVGDRLTLEPSVSLGLVHEPRVQPASTRARVDNNAFIESNLAAREPWTSLTLGMHVDVRYRLSSRWALVLASSLHHAPIRGEPVLEPFIDLAVPRLAGAPWFFRLGAGLGFGFP